MPLFLLWILFIDFVITAVVALLKNAGRHPLSLNSGNWVCASNGFHSQIMGHAFLSFQSGATFRSPKPKSQFHYRCSHLHHLVMSSLFSKWPYCTTVTDSLFLLSCRCSIRWPTQEGLVRLIFIFYCVFPASFWCSLLTLLSQKFK